MARRRTGRIEIEVSEIVYQLEDDDLLDELRSRKLITAPSGEAYDQDLVKEAFNELQVGRVAEALSILDRLLNPKWPTQKACETAYIKQQGKML